MIQTPPTVSIIMPAYNAGKTIGPMIKSILGQTYQDFELIIVDDGSTDNTYELVKSFSDPRIVLIRNRKNLKISKSLNIAIAAAKGKYLARSDADDLNMPDRLQVQVAFLESHPDIDLVGSDAYIFNAHGELIGGNFIGSTDHAGITRHINWRTPLIHGSIMARAEWMEKYKYLEIPLSEDHELFLRSYKQSQFANIPRYLYVYRNPERMDIKKLISSNWNNILFRWKHWREYGMPARCVLGYLLLVAGRFLYYSIGAVSNRSFLWAHLTPIMKGDNHLQDQSWVMRCLHSG